MQTIARLIPRSFSPMKTLLKLFPLLLMIVICVRPSSAQTAGGSIQGVLTDATGAVIPNAEVVIRNVATGLTRAVKTNAAGLYNAPLLPAGAYEITAKATGFSTEVVTGIVLTVGAEQVVNLAMKLGAVGEKVEVSGGAPSVDLATSTLGHVVNEKSIQELPLNGRDWTQLATLQPGVQIVRAQDLGDSSRTQRGNGIQMSISGGRPSENNYRLNGITINDYANTGPGSALGINLGVDAIQEFSVLTSTYSAEYGRTSGGVINAITRSGANDLHGSGYYFHRNRALDARNFFDISNTPPPFRRHQYGGSIGGPVRHDKTFFFMDYEELREFLSQTVNSVAPSAAARNGDLSTGKVSVNPAVAPFLNLYPLPNAGLIGKGDSGSYVFAGRRLSHQEFVTGKIDHKFSDRDALNGTYLFDNALINAPDEFNNKAVSVPSRRQNITLEETHIFSPTLFNSLRVGFVRVHAADGLSQDIFNPLLKDPSLGFLPGSAAGQITVSGLTTFTGGAGGTNSYEFFYNSFQEYDDLLITRGKHSIKLGGGVERIQNNYNSTNLPAGSYAFGSLAGLLQGQGTNFQAQLPGSDTARGVRQTVVGAYVQDDYHVLRNLTLNVGLRYEIATVPTESNGKIGTLRSPTDTQVTVGQLFHNNTFKNFAPRVGFAWDPFGSGKTSVRAGFGMFDVLPLSYLFVNRITRTPPFFRTGLTSNPPASAFPKGAFALLGPQSFRTIYIEQNPKRSYKLQYNLTLQRQLSESLSITVGFVGARGIHLPKSYEDIDIVPPTRKPFGYVWPLNSTTNSRINPSFGRIAGTYWNVDSYYHALQLAVSKRLSRGLQFQASYTWQKSIDDGSNTFSDNEFTTTIGNPVWFDPGYNRSLSDYDVRHVFTLSYLYGIPMPSRWAAPLRTIAGGWQFGGIFSAQTGSPFTVVTTADRAITRNSQVGNYLGQRPNLLPLPGCDSLVNPGDVKHYVKLNCFSFPAAGTLGNLGRNTLTGPGLLNLDLSLFKNVPVRKISETFRAQFRAEFFNVMNHANFALPDNTRYQIFDANGNLTGNAGQLFKTQTPSRQIQFGLKLSF